MCKPKYKNNNFKGHNNCFPYFYYNYVLLLLVLLLDMSAYTIILVKWLLSKRHSHTNTNVVAIIREVLLGIFIVIVCLSASSNLRTLAGN